MNTGGLVSSADERNKGSCEEAVSVDVVGEIVAPALAALTEVEGDVVAAPLEVFEAKGFVAAFAIFVLVSADVIAAPVLDLWASIHALGLMGKNKKKEEEDKPAHSFCQHRADLFSSKFQHFQLQAGRFTEF